MPFTHNPALSYTHLAGHEKRFTIPISKWFQGFDLINELTRDLLKAQFAIDTDLSRQCEIIRYIKDALIEG